MVSLKQIVRVSVFAVIAAVTSPALAFAGAHCPHPAGFTCYEVDTYFDGKLIGWTCSCSEAPL